MVNPIHKIINVSNDDAIKRLHKTLDKYGGDEKYKVWHVVKKTKKYMYLEDEKGNKKRKLL